VGSGKREARRVRFRREKQSQIYFAICKTVNGKWQKGLWKGYVTTVIAREADNHPLVF
jgi:hypothetical protein